MAAESEAITVTVVASTKEFEKQIATLSRSVEKALKKVDDTIDKSGRGLGKGIGQGGKEAAAGLANTSHAAGQLSFQLNDIATSLAGGASPFQVMMQQGSQVTQVMADIKAKGGSMGATVAGAFTSMLNPMALVANGLILVAGLAVQYFMASKEGSEEAHEAAQEAA